MKKKHILLLFSHYRTPADLGGLRSWHIGSHHAGKGFQVTAVVPGVDTLTGIRKTCLQNRLWSSEVLNGVNVIWTNAIQNDRKSKVRRALYYLSASFLQFLASMSVRKVDIIVTMSIPFTSILFGFLQSAYRKIPLVIDVRDLPTDTALELEYFKQNFAVNILLKLEKWLFNRADSLVTVSEGWKDRLVEKGVSPQKIEVIPIGFDGKKIYTGHTDWNRNIRDELCIADNFIVVYTGTLGHILDISTLLKSAQITAHNRNIVYLIVGSGQLLEDYKKQALDNNLNCIFLGPRPKADIPLFCSQADVCLCPYKKGKFVASILGNKIFDYLGNGTTTIYSGPDSDVKRLIEQSKGGICVPSGDAQGVAEAILHYYDNPDELKIAGGATEKYINDNYMAQNMMEKFEKVIVTTLENRG